MEQTLKAKLLSKQLRRSLPLLLGASARARNRRLMDEAADMIDALIAGSALSDPSEDGVVLGASETSKQAALDAFPRSGTQRHRVLNCIVAAGLLGLTDEEMQKMLLMGPNTQRPRRVELAKGGWIVDSGKRRPTDSGNPSIVWVSSGRPWVS